MLNSKEKILPHFLGLILEPDILLKDHKLLFWTWCMSWCSKNQYERHDSYDVAGYITKKVRLEVIYFAGKIDYQVYLDWLASWDGYFTWYDVSDERKVKFAIIKLVGQAQICWRDVGNDCRLAEQPPIVMWDYMKQKIIRKYQPCDYEDELFHQLTNLRQGEHVGS